MLNINIEINKLFYIQKNYRIDDDSFLKHLNIPMIFIDTHVFCKLIRYLKKKYPNPTTLEIELN